MGATLTEFLLARLGEDETEARAVMVAGRGAEDTGESVEQMIEGAAVTDAARRRLADITARQAIVELHCENSDIVGLYELRCLECSGANYPCTTLRLLGLAFAHHPDYRQTWRP